MLKRVVLILFFLFQAHEAHALNFYKFMYKVEEGDTFSLILKRFVKENSIINAKTPLVKKIRKYNPHVKNWTKIPPDTILELYISNDFMDLKKYRAYEANPLKNIDKKTGTNPSYPTGLKGSVFYMASVGLFTQNSSDAVEINFKQNSPASVGTAFTYYPKDKLYSTSFSAYVSYLLGSSNTLNADKVSIPPEIGGNIYQEYRWQKYNTTLYAGPDYENFSTFNLRSLQNEQQIYLDKVGALYLTVGLARSFYMFKEQFFMKLSASKSVMTTYKSGAPLSSEGESSHNDLGEYSGYRFLFYLNYKVNKKFYLHSLLKYHTMTGPSNLTTFRVGVGVGLILF